jgi:hypothetical protein
MDTFTYVCVAYVPLYSQGRKHGFAPYCILLYVSEVMLARVRGSGILCRIFVFVIRAGKKSSRGTQQ